MNPVVIRTKSAGAWAGQMTGTIGDGIIRTTVTLYNARRLWYWDGAASLSELAVKGVRTPRNCKFPIAVEVVDLNGVIEIIKMTPDAWENILNVPIWTMQ